VGAGLLQLALDCWQIIVIAGKQPAQVKMCLHRSKGNAKCGDGLPHLSAELVCLLSSGKVSCLVYSPQMSDDQSHLERLWVGHKNAFGSGSIPVGYVNGAKMMFVLEVCVNDQCACLSGGKGAVCHWASLVEDESRPANVVGLGHMCVHHEWFWKGRKCAVKIMMGSNPVAVDAAGCKGLETPLALHALLLVVSTGESFASQSSLDGGIRSEGATSPVHVIFHHCQ